MTGVAPGCQPELQNRYESRRVPIESTLGACGTEVINKITFLNQCKIKSKPNIGIYRLDKLQKVNNFLHMEHFETVFIGITA